MVVAAATAASGHRCETLRLVAATAARAAIAASTCQDCSHCRSSRLVIVSQWSLLYSSSYLLQPFLLVVIVATAAVGVHFFLWKCTILIESYSIPAWCCSLFGVFVVILVLVIKYSRSYYIILVFVFVLVNKYSTRGHPLRSIEGL